MNWPTPTDYRHAIQDPGHALADEELRQGEAARNARGLPTLWSGNFASVFRIDCPAAGNTWALKCFTREVRARQERYRHIAAALETARLPFTVPFEYLERGIRVQGRWYPAVKMHWVEGQTLNRFVEESLDKPAMLRQLLALWPKLAARLRDAGIAHADLQHGNVLLVRQRGGQLALRLIDYDGMYVPALAGTESGESGHPNYQHPRRREQRAYNLDVDRFSHLAIYGAVHGLLVGKRDLWQRFNNDENLLFRESDFQKPRQSELFRALWELGDPAGRALAGRLALACERPLATTPWLDEMVHGREVKGLTQAEQQAIGAMLAVPAAVPAGPTVAVPPPQPLPRVATQDATPGVIAPPDPLPTGTQPGATAGTEPDALPTISVATVSPLPSGERSVTPLRSFGRLPLHGLGAFDRKLARLARENNSPMHVFLRVASVTVAAMFAVILFGAIGMWSSAGRPWVAEQGGVESPQNEARPPLEKELAIDIGDGAMLEMVLIPAGEFMMGSPDSDRDAEIDEKPRHRVQITRPFYLGKYELTQQQWQAVMGTNPNPFAYPTNPVEQVSWSDCQEFLKKLNERTADSLWEFRLPTEAEWEYACRAGTTTRYSFGDDASALDQYAWYNANSGRRTHAVGQKKPNAWGLYDMHGNVFEWCADWYNDRYDAGLPVNDPPGSASGSFRVIRGGSWKFPAEYCRSACRDRNNPDDRILDLGFRVALAPACAEVSDEPLQTLRPEPLRLQALAEQRVEVGSTVSLTILPEDAERWSRRLRYSLSPDAPTGATIDASMGAFTWTPAADQEPGKYHVVVVAESPAGEKAQASLAIEVTRTQLVIPAFGPKEIHIEIGAGVNLELVLIPDGEFMMGSPDSDPNAQEDEKPQRRVRMTRPFYLGKYEVTQAEWETVMGTNPSRFKGLRNPVEQVSWNDCQDFLRRLNERVNDRRQEFRLPTEAQWEYACRAGTTTQYSFGHNGGQLGEYAWYHVNSDTRTHPVGQKHPNAWGLYDMHGNVWEWCADWYAHYDAISPVDDPPGPASASRRVLRGGSWGGVPRLCRSASRNCDTPVTRLSSFGFRVALVRSDVKSSDEALRLEDPDSSQAETLQNHDSKLKKPLPPKKEKPPTFRDLPGTVELPPPVAAEGQPAPAGPITLGKVYVRERVPWVVGLSGGEVVAPNAEITISRDAAEVGRRGYLFQLTPIGGVATAIARLWHEPEPDELKFQWLEAAVQSHGADRLRFCQIKLTIDGEQRTLALSRPAPAPPLEFDFAKKNEQVKIRCDSLPDERHLRLEVTTIEGISPWTHPFQTEPDGPLEVNKPLTLTLQRVDRNRNHQPIAQLEIRFSSFRTGLTIARRIQQPAKPIVPLDSRLPAYRQELSNEFFRLDDQLKKRPLSREQNQLNIQMNQIEQLLGQADLFEYINRKAKIHYRILLAARNYQTTLFDSQVADPAEAKPDK